MTENGLYVSYAQNGLTRLGCKLMQKLAVVLFLLAVAQEFDAPVLRREVHASAVASLLPDPNDPLCRPRCPTDTRVPLILIHAIHGTPGGADLSQIYGLGNPKIEQWYHFRNFFYQEPVLPTKFRLFVFQFRVDAKVRGTTGDEEVNDFHRNLEQSTANKLGQLATVMASGQAGEVLSKNFERIPRREVEAERLNLHGVHGKLREALQLG